MNVNIQKQLEFKDVEVGGNVFHIKPFPAFTAANLSGELAALLLPVVGGVASVVPDKAFEEGVTVENVKASIDDMDIDSVLPTMSKAFSGLSGDKFEALMKKLLIVHKNISVDIEDNSGEEKTVLLNFDIANEVFCGDVQDMYVLCYHVIKINFSGFFKKVGSLFGKQKETTEETATSNLTAPLT